MRTRVISEGQVPAIGGPGQAVGLVVFSWVPYDLHFFHCFFSLMLVRAPALRGVAHIFNSGSRKEGRLCRGAPFLL